VSAIAEQLDMFAIDVALRKRVRVETPAARRTDPESSHRAAEEVTSLGTRAHQQQQVLEAVRLWPMCTSAELAKRSNLDRYVLGRRLPELRTGGVIENPPDPINPVGSKPRPLMRACRETGRLAMLWRIRRG
jgi:CRP-like cAMP-binding protein